MNRDIQRLMLLFKDSHINASNELILIPKTNLYFILDGVETLEDIYYKIFAWCSRDACYSMPYKTDRNNETYRATVRHALNQFIGVDLSKDEWCDIYCKYGNGINSNDCHQYIKTLIGESK